MVLGPFVVGLSLSVIILLFLWLLCSLFKLLCVSLWSFVWILCLVVILCPYFEV